MDLETDSGCYFSDILRFKPAHLNMMYFTNRMQTYTNWPDQIKQKPEDLAHNGFFYTDIGDRVTCFYCDITLKKWTKEDDIETEHIKWDPNCLFTKMVSSKTLSNILMK